MQIAFNGGEVRAELVDNSVYLRARDLRKVVNAVSHNTNKIKQRSNITEYVNLESKVSSKQAHYVKLSEAFNYLDAIHVDTRPQTMMLMGEIATQFENQLYPE